MPAIVALACLVAWGILVWVAVGFGADARGGESSAWAKLAVAAIAAVGCLFLTFTFAGKAWRILSGGSNPPPPADDYSGSHSNAFVEEQDFPDQGYYNSGAYGYDDTATYGGQHGTDTGSQRTYGGDPYGETYGGDTGSQSTYGYPGSQPSFGDTGPQTPYAAPTYQPPSRAPQPSQPYYSGPPTPSSTPASTPMSTPPSTPRSTPAYGAGYTTGGYPTQQPGGPQYQSGSYQRPSGYGRRTSTGPTSGQQDTTQALPAQQQPAEPPAPAEDEWPPRRSSRIEEWPPANPENNYRPRH